jgi:CubicO group peptidase (beta-lactamase class C family)
MFDNFCMRALTLALTSLALSVSTLHAQRATKETVAAPAGWPTFTRLFDSYADSDRVVGASVLVMRSGQTLARHDYGFADRAAGQRVNERTLFHYGSITKTLTAIGIMQLRDRGRLTLDDKVTRYIPELRQVHDPYGMIDSITIRMLLSHTAGFQNPTWPYTEDKDWEPFEPTTWNQLVAMMPYQELHFRPGSRYSYSNPAFIYLARIIEQLTGDPWEAYVQKNIFAPLGLTRSYFNGTPYYLAADRSNNYTIRRLPGDAGGDTLVANGRDFNPGITIPNGGWNAPLADLATYSTFLTGVARDDSTRARQNFVLSRSSLQEMWKPVYPMSSTAVNPDSMALSFFVVHRDGATILGHTGSQAGFRSFLFFNPATTTVVIAAFNTTNAAGGGGPSPARTSYARMYEAALSLLR